MDYIFKLSYSLTVIILLSDICTGVSVPGVHALHQDLILFTLHHVVGEHGVEVRDGGRQHDPVSAELVIPDLRTDTLINTLTCYSPVAMTIIAN